MEGEGARCEQRIVWIQQSAKTEAEKAVRAEFREAEKAVDLNNTQLKKRMKERGIEASGCTEVTGTPTLARTPCLTAATPRAPTP